MPGLLLRALLLRPPSRLAQGVRSKTTDIGSDVTDTYYRLQLVPNPVTECGEAIVMHLQGSAKQFLLLGRQPLPTHFSKEGRCRCLIYSPLQSAVLPCR
ncbi:hypothetical protein BGZ61DRAFT_104132 [Ilyonectria robusta]|uniref:uncharacterized protein n=1 Tax=Ilyonectria robusta TaxID=1079257 RepID=UPI001E8DE8CF|nr:uncharacterized protein BGZ61DRAFT_104132 [Ilyonectria robusta]KAH8673191.1 hypothetical protein BGZ61DRAFT_104132 [Ilyonectria robusta]